MKQLMYLGVIIAVALSLGCAYYSAPVMPPGGALFENVKGPIDTDAENTPIGYRCGESKSISILGLFAFGDCSISSAAHNGAIKTVEHVDYAYLNVLGIYQAFTTIAYGE